MTVHVAKEQRFPSGWSPVTFLVSYQRGTKQVQVVQWVLKTINAMRQVWCDWLRTRAEMLIPWTHHSWDASMLRQLRTLRANWMFLVFLSPPYLLFHVDIHENEPTVAFLQKNPTMQWAFPASPNWLTDACIHRSDCVQCLEPESRLDSWRPVPRKTESDISEESRIYHFLAQKRSRRVSFQKEEISGRKNV